MTHLNILSVVHAFVSARAYVSVEIRTTFRFSSLFPLWVLGLELSLCINARHFGLLSYLADPEHLFKQT